MSKKIYGWRLIIIQKYFITSVYTLLIGLILVLFSCTGKKRTDIRNGYILTYVDNNGVCIPCSQMRKISKDVIKKRFSEKYADGELIFDFILTRDERYVFLREMCRAYPKSLVFIRIKNGREVKYRLIETLLIYMMLDKPEKCMDVIEKEMIDFMKEEK